MRSAGGDLDLFGISNVLQMLSSSGAWGVLAVRKGRLRKAIEFGRRGIRLLSGVRRTHPLGEILVRSGRLSAARLEGLLARQRETGRRLGDLLAEEGVLSKDSVELALREQVAEEIYELFTWTDARFSFRELPPDGATGEEEGALASVTLDSSVMSIMLEAARRMDEMNKIRELIPDGRLVPVQMELPVEADDPGLDPGALEEILGLVDGERPIDRIVEESLYPKFTVLRTLYALVQRGSVKIRDRGEGVGPITVLFKRPSLEESTPPNGQTVLLLSELATYRNALAFCLRRAGFTVHQEARWDALAEALSRECVHAIVLDLSIETDDALALCATLRGRSKVPFILLSENRSRKAVSNALRSGARHVLLKPIKESLLVERLSEMLGAPAEKGSEATHAG